MIYFIGNDHGAIKMGYTAGLDVQHRLDSLQGGNADQLMALGYEDGTKVDEGNLQARFAHFKIRGEWFAAADELLDYILSLPATNRADVQSWIAVMLPKGNTADLQWLIGQIRINALDKAKKRSQDIIEAAHMRAEQIISFAIDCAASDIKELIIASCDPSLFDCRCCKCSRARHTVKEREDGLPWCDPCWVNHAIFDSGRFDIIMARAKSTILSQRDP